MHLTLSSRLPLPNIPSASGIEITGKHIYMIGDDSPFLFRLNKKLEVLEKIQIASTKDLAGDRIPKKQKSDWEAMTLVQHKGMNEIFVFGSGSKKKRKVLVRIGYDEKPVSVKTSSLKELYKKIIKTTGISKDDLNIEAAAANKEFLFLFNRGVNLVLKYKLKEIFSYLDNGSIPTPEVFKINLPSIKNIQSGFSGATFVPGENKIIFCASVENSSNWIDDGEVLGSFIGLIDLEELFQSSKTLEKFPGHTPDCLPIKEAGQILKIKVESVAVKGLSNKELELLLVTDSDGGVSEIIEARLKEY